MTHSVHDGLWWKPKTSLPVSSRKAILRCRFRIVRSFRNWRNYKRWDLIASHRNHLGIPTSTFREIPFCSLARTRSASRSKYHHFTQFSEPVGLSCALGALSALSLPSIWFWNALGRHALLWGPPTLLCSSFSSSCTLILSSILSIPKAGVLLSQHINERVPRIFYNIPWSLPNSVLSASLITG